MNRLAEVVADALVAVVWFVDAKHAAWTRITDDAPRVP